MFESTSLCVCAVAHSVLCACGFNLDRIKTEDFLAEDIVKSVIREVLETVVFLHSKGYAHRDIKPEVC